MNGPPYDICPLLALAGQNGPAKCLQDHCAWFTLKYNPDGDFTSGKCAVVRIADVLSRKFGE